MRIDKFIANNTNNSRSQVNKLLKNKQVKLNEQIITNGAIHISNNDLVFIDNKLVNKINNFYIALNKPKNYICSNSNKDGEPIINLIDEKYHKNIHIIGRLDKDTTGLVLLTNDGRFTHQIKSPSKSIEKEYFVELENEITNEMIEKLNNITHLDNKKLKKFEVNKVNEYELKIILIEGKYHQVKRLINISGNDVKNLKRIRIGNLKLDELNIDVGQWKLINKDLIK